MNYELNLLELEEELAKLKALLEKMDDTILSEKLLAYKALSLLAVGAGLAAIQSSRESGREMDNVKQQTQRISRIVVSLAGLYAIEKDKLNS